MDPGRKAMLANPRSPSRRDFTSPRIDQSNRVTKASRQAPPKSSNGKSRFLSEDEQSRQFVADEDKFVLKQSKKKADIRVRDGRAKPIDFFAFNIRYIDSERDIFDDEDGDVDIDIKSPTDIMQNLNAVQLTELDSDIASYHVLETDPRNKKYWEALRALCSDQKEKLNPRGNEGRVVNSVADDIDKILAPKSFEQLEGLEKQIRAKLRGNEEIDTDYWEQLLRSLLVWKSKANLAQIYEELRTKHNQRRAAVRATAATDLEQPSTSLNVASESTTGTVPTPAVVAAESTQVSGANTSNEDVSQATMALYNRERARGVTENEEIFTAEEVVPSAVKPQWADQYRARKPRYFNRVQMGYEWNKYNQTHYDHDNPPPKVVQGYKFNIFYPELIDKTKAPTFKIIREHGRRRGESFAAAGEEDTCLLRFIAGPPYEDLAFRIVDREWDYSAKKDRGFRSSFDKGILQLHFQFKKIFYRK